MTRTQIRLDTLSDVNRFVAEMTRINDEVWLEDGNGSRVSAKKYVGRSLFYGVYTHLLLLRKRHQWAFDAMDGVIVNKM